MRHYHVRARVRAAIDEYLKGNTKSSSVARLVGYASEKNFYPAVRDVTGLTPARLSALSPSELRLMRAGLMPRAKRST